ncbi:isocitrate lyase/phosphoenolpyruvate mutase family protein [Pseudoxanthomonas putridarboris]|uniref:Isocitrate lyase/phosphoenolpyruvate mutase family protein n=1 Tax=Pseudoxanthomonas putridarboris TaxID=752605 RepID=A0ABU9J0V3_9GAMM
MTTQTDKARLFHSLHAGDRPLVLFNIWDPGSAKAVADAGARALATGSWSVAAANGYKDGEHLPLELALDNLARIVANTDLPVTVDLESGYGATAAEVGRTVQRAIEAGAVGCNLEDSHPADGRLRPLAEQVERLVQVRKAADASGVALFINARTDVFFQKPAEAHDAEMVAQALERARAYAAAGADGLFVPGLVDGTLIANLVAALPLPVNVMVGAGTPALARLAELGVARISHGPGPYLTAMRTLAEAAAKASDF